MHGNTTTYGEKAQACGVNNGKGWEEMSKYASRQTNRAMREYSQSSMKAEAISGILWEKAEATQRRVQRLQQESICGGERHIGNLNFSLYSFYKIWNMTGAGGRKYLKKRNDAITDERERTRARGSSSLQWITQTLKNKSLEDDAEPKTTKSARTLYWFRLVRESATR